MKNNILLICLLLLPCMMNAQKVVERSQHNTPKWVNGTEIGYLIVSAEASDVDTAKDKILSKLKSLIAESVATRVLSESTLRSSETMVNHQAVEYTEQYQSVITSKAANIPFVKEISLSKASDFYWEKVYNKKSKEYSVHYHIKYPLSELELKNMVFEFLKHEAELDARIKQYGEDLSAIPSVDFIDKTLNDLRAFLQEFTKDDPRYGQVEQLLNNYRKSYKNIIIEEVENRKGYVSVRLMLNQRPIRCSQNPKITSNCASQFNPSYNEDLLIVRYDDSDCYEDDTNYIDIRFRFGNEFISKKIFFKK